MEEMPKVSCVSGSQLDKVSFKQDTAHAKSTECGSASNNTCQPVKRPHEEDIRGAEGSGNDVAEWKVVIAPQIRVMLKKYTGPSTIRIPFHQVNGDSNTTDSPPKKIMCDVTASELISSVTDETRATDFPCSSIIDSIATSSFNPPPSKIRKISESCTESIIDDDISDRTQESNTTSKNVTVFHTQNSSNKEFTASSKTVETANTQNRNFIIDSKNSSNNLDKVAKKVSKKTTQIIKSNFEKLKSNSYVSRQEIEKDVSLKRKTQKDNNESDFTENMVEVNEDMNIEISAVESVNNGDMIFDVNIKQELEDECSEDNKIHYHDITIKEEPSDYIETLESSGSPCSLGSSDNVKYDGMDDSRGSVLMKQRKPRNVQQIWNVKQEQQDQSSDSETPPKVEQVQKRGRGRPRNVVLKSQIDAPKGRGRPKTVVQRAESPVKSPTMIQRPSSVEEVEDLTEIQSVGEVEMPNGRPRRRIKKPKAPCKCCSAEDDPVSSEKKTMVKKQTTSPCRSISVTPPKQTGKKTKTTEGFSRPISACSTPAKQNAKKKPTEDSSSSSSNSSTPAKETARKNSTTPKLSKQTTKKNSSDDNCVAKSMSPTPPKQKVAKKPQADTTHMSIPPTNKEEAETKPPANMNDSLVSNHNYTSPTKTSEPSNTEMKKPVDGTAINLAHRNLIHQVKTSDTNEKPETKIDNNLKVNPLLTNLTPEETVKLLHLKLLQVEADNKLQLESVQKLAALEKLRSDLILNNMKALESKHDMEIKALESSLEKEKKSSKDYKHKLNDCQKELSDLTKNLQKLKSEHSNCDSKISNYNNKKQSFKRTLELHENKINKNKRLAKKKIIKYRRKLKKAYVKIAQLSKRKYFSDEDFNEWQLNCDGMSEQGEDLIRQVAADSEPNAEFSDSSLTLEEMETEFLDCASQHSGFSSIPESTFSDELESKVIEVVSNADTESQDQKSDNATTQDEMTLTENENAQQSLIEEVADSQLEETKIDVTLEDKLADSEQNPITIIPDSQREKTKIDVTLEDKLADSEQNPITPVSNDENKTFVDDVTIADTEQNPITPVSNDENKTFVDDVTIEQTSSLPCDSNPDNVELQADKGPVHDLKMPLGILISPGFREKPLEGRGRKSVVFGDGVRPGEGSPQYDRNEMHSPPPNSKKKKEKARKREEKRKKKKLKDKSDGMKTSPEVDDEEDDNLPAPPPPPGSPPLELKQYYQHFYAAVAAGYYYSRTRRCYIPLSAKYLAKVQLTAQGNSVKPNEENSKESPINPPLPLNEPPKNPAPPPPLPPEDMNISPPPPPSEPPPIPCNPPPPPVEPPLLFCNPPPPPELESLPPLPHFPHPGDKDSSFTNISDIIKACKQVANRRCILPTPPIESDSIFMNHDSSVQLNRPAFIHNRNYPPYPHRNSIECDIPVNHLSPNVDNNYHPSNFNDQQEFQRRGHYVNNRSRSRSLDQDDNVPWYDSFNMDHERPMSSNHSRTNFKKCEPSSSIHDDVLPWQERSNMNHDRPAPSNYTRDNFNLIEPVQEDLMQWHERSNVDHESSMASNHLRGNFDRRKPMWRTLKPVVSLPEQDFSNDDFFMKNEYAICDVTQPLPPGLLPPPLPPHPPPGDMCQNMQMLHGNDHSSFIWRGNISKRRKKSRFS